MRFHTIRLLLVIILSFSASCGSDSDEQTLEGKYQAAIDDARIAEASELRDDLVAILPENEELVWDEQQPSRVLVTTLTDWAGYQEYVGAEMVASRELWVTVVPDVLNFCREHLSADEDPVLRLEQLLGLDNRNRTLMVEMYADPVDMFRPTPDPEITDTVAQLDFPAEVSPEHVSWFNSLLATSYEADGYPWTRLGYTCDWVHGGCRAGLSEFVVRSQSVVQVTAIHQVADYCQSGE